MTDLLVIVSCLYQGLDKMYRYLEGTESGQLCDWRPDIDIRMMALINHDTFRYSDDTMQHNS